MSGAGSRLPGVSISGINARQRSLTLYREALSRKFYPASMYWRHSAPQTWAGLCGKGLLPAPSGSQRWAVCWPRCLAAQDASVLACRGSCRALGGQGSGRSSPVQDVVEVVHTQLGFHSEAEEGTGQGGRAGPSLQAEPWRPDCPVGGESKALVRTPVPSRDAVWFPHTTFRGISQVLPEKRPQLRAAGGARREVPGAPGLKWGTLAVTHLSGMSTQLQNSVSSPRV